MTWKPRGGNGQLSHRLLIFEQEKHRESTIRFDSSEASNALGKSRLSAMVGTIPGLKWFKKKEVAEIWR